MTLKLWNFLLSQFRQLVVVAALSQLRLVVMVEEEVAGN